MGLEKVNYISLRLIRAVTNPVFFMTFGKLIASKWRLELYPKEFKEEAVALVRD